jgi:flagellar hook-associated protein 3 FlgL
MLDRVGTLSLSQGMITEYGRIQSRTVKLQMQISSGKVGDSLADVKDKAFVLVAAKQKAAGVASLLATTKEVGTRLDLQDVHLQQLSDITARLRSSVGNAIAAGRAGPLMEEVRSLYAEAVGVLNYKMNGNYLYGGTRTDTSPVSATDLAALAAAPDVASILRDNGQEMAVTLDEGESLTVGMTARAVGSDLLQMFKDIADFNAGAGGPLTGTLNPAQMSFLTAANVQIPGIQSGVTEMAALNGTRHEQVERAAERLETMSSYFAKFIGDIEDVDLAEAVARLNRDQVAAEAAGRMIAQISETNLLKFL